MTTTVEFTTVSRIFCCKQCGADVRLDVSQGNELYYVCTNSACQKAVGVDVPEALAIRKATVRHAADMAAA
jgi:hypothetical protein